MVLPTPLPPSGGVSLQFYSLLARARARRALRGGCEQPVVASTLDLNRQFWPARAHEPPFGKHVHVMRLHVVQDALVVGDDENAEVRPGNGVDPLGDRP